MIHHAMSCDMIEFNTCGLRDQHTKADELQSELLSLFIYEKQSRFQATTNSKERNFILM